MAAYSDVAMLWASHLSDWLLGAAVALTLLAGLLLAALTAGVGRMSRPNR
jgi:hypothetical protein